MSPGESYIYIYCHLVVKDGNFICLPIFCGQEWQLHMSKRHLVVKKDNFIFPLTCSGQEWQFHIASHM